MEEIIETNVSADVVWRAWERFQTNQKGKAGAFKYRVLDVQPGRSFSILWKTLFVRFIFTHRVEAIPRGSRISCGIEIRGLFAFPMRLLIGNKIRKNVAATLKSFVKQLENLQ